MISGLLLAAQHMTCKLPGVGCVVFIRSDIYETLRLPERDRFRSEEIHLNWPTAGLADRLLVVRAALLGRGGRGPDSTGSWTAAGR